jgi:hypothetical protein
MNVENWKKGERENYFLLVGFLFFLRPEHFFLLLPTEKKQKEKK